MEDNIKDMRIRHKAEVYELQERQCRHLKEKITESPFEKHTICVNCGKLLKRIRK
jgi:hypothetical protein